MQGLTDRYVVFDPALLTADDADDADQIGSFRSLLKSQIL